LSVWASDFPLSSDQRTKSIAAADRSGDFGAFGIGTNVVAVIG